MSMSQEERDIEDAITASRKPMKDWESNIAQGDFTSRDIENIIDSMTDTERSRLPVETLDKYVAKKVVRADKPKEYTA